MRRALRILYPLILIAGWLVFATPANAAIADCKEAPIAESPGSGMSGFFAGQPSTIPADPKGGAWENGAPLYANYGTAGLTFHTYDLGCGVDTVRDPGAVLGSNVANWGTEFPKMCVAITGALLNAAYDPTYLRAFDPMIENAIAALRDAVFTPWVTVMLVIVGVGILVQARKALFSHSVTIVGWGLGVMVLASIVFTWPTTAGAAADEVVGGSLAGINTALTVQTPSGNPGDDATGMLSNAVLFEEWKMGTFGRSEVPDKWVKGIYTAQALTWEEAATVRRATDAAADPNAEPTPNVLPDGTPMPEGMIENSNPTVNAGTELLAEKAKQWEGTAAEIKEQDPEVYEYLTGTKSGARMGAMMLSWWAGIFTGIPMLVSPLLMIGSFLILRLAVMAFPLIATIGVAYHFRGIVITVGTACAAAVINSILFGTGAAFNILAAKMLIAPGSPVAMWLGVILMGVISLIIWVVTKPLRKLTTMVDPNRVARDALGSAKATGQTAKHRAVSGAKTFVGTYTGTAPVINALEQKAQTRRRSESLNVADEPTPPPPTPTPPVEVGEQRERGAA